MNSGSFHLKGMLGGCIPYTHIPLRKIETIGLLGGFAPCLGATTL